MNGGEGALASHGWLPDLPRFLAIAISYEARAVAVRIIEASRGMERYF